MKKLAVLCSLIAVVLLALPGLSRAEIAVEAAAIATGIEDHAPVGVGESFPYDTEVLYCYSKITGGAEGDHVEHRWYFKDTLMATVPLNVNGPSWRTHSSKRIIRIWEGEWRVDIINAGEVLKSLKFTITGPEPEAKYSEEAGDELKVSEEPASEAPATEAPAGE